MKKQFLLFLTLCGLQQETQSAELKNEDSLFFEKTAKTKLDDVSYVFKNKLDKGVVKAFNNNPSPETFLSLAETIDKITEKASTRAEDVNFNTLYKYKSKYLAYALFKELSVFYKKNKFDLNKLLSDHYPALGHKITDELLQVDFFVQSRDIMSDFVVKKTKSLELEKQLSILKELSTYALPAHQFDTFSDQIIRLENRLLERDQKLFTEFATALTKLS
ncbi:MAG: hypothetical protein UV38_C0002G0103 [candidate division TM6 bacterium GW2011_GWE2_42_60]|nr:MAG: hypothetical protein UV38_C0002G0103 [candidate division TM6 bacterium GW2011_GWE2_42_60]HBY06138.1 hypothetical protein [Candidatus Dependentiae bacterium]